MNNFIPNSFQVPNALVDDIISTLNANSLKCYLVIVRKTVGWNKEWDKISTTQLMQLTGIKKKDTIYNAIKELENLNLIECDKTQGKLTNYRLVLINGTSTDKGAKVVPINGTTTSTDERDSTKDNKKHTKQKRKDPFNLPCTKSFDNLSDEYKEMLKNKIEEHNEELTLRRLNNNSLLTETLSYEEFENRFLASGKKQKDFWRTFLQYEKYVFEAESKRKGIKC